MGKKKIFLEDYYFHGKQADMAKELSEVPIDKESGAKIFRTTVDLYAACAIVGFFFDKKAQVTKGEQTRAILQNAFSSRYDILEFIYKLVLLYSNEFATDEERIDRAFRDPKTDENYDLFNSYVLGGLEEIYKNIYLEKNVRFIDFLQSTNEFLKKFDEDPDAETKKLVSEITNEALY